jgi:hypothetical protein
MAMNFLNSPEFRNGTGPRLTAFLLHALILGRGPTSGELAATSTRVATHPAQLDTVIAEMLNSSEFSAEVVPW